MVYRVQPLLHLCHVANVGVAEARPAAPEGDHPEKFLLALKKILNFFGDTGAAP
jgi:hypothetical protein